MPSRYSKKSRRRRQRLPDEIVQGFNWIRGRFHTKGMNSLRLEWSILKICRGYSRLIVRQLYYILVSKFKYPATRNFYKRVVYHTTKMRRLNPKLSKKFTDPTRIYTEPPLSYGKILVICEKDSIRNFIQPLAARYRLPVQTLRGFGSLSCFERTVERAKRRGTKLVFYLGDFGPSGIDIQRCASKELNSDLGLQFVRLAVTWNQIRRLRLPSRPVSAKDSRTKAYAAKWGTSRKWDIESIRSRTLKKIVEAGFKKYLPKEFLETAEARERAAKVARPLTEKLRKLIERETAKMLKEDLSEEEALRHLSEKYGVPIRKRKTHCMHAGLP